MPCMGDGMLMGIPMVGGMPPGGGRPAMSCSMFGAAEGGIMPPSEGLGTDVVPISGGMPPPKDGLGTEVVPMLGGMPVGIVIGGGRPPVENGAPDIMPGPPMPAHMPGGRTAARPPGGNTVLGMCPGIGGLPPENCASVGLPRAEPATES